MAKRKVKLFSKARVAIGLAIALVVMGGGYMLLSRQNAQPRYGGPTEKVVMGVVGEYGSLVLIAHEKGYFKENGLDVTLKDYPSGPAALADLLQGKLDMTTASDFAGVRNSFVGESVKILANVNKSETFYMIARKSHGINKVADLKGKKVGITRQTVGEYYTGQFMTFNNMALSDIRVVDMPQANLIDALANGTIDAAVVFEPNAYKATAKIGDDALRWSVQGGQSLYTLLYSTSAFVRDHPATAERYMRSLVQAEDFVKKHDTEARAIVAKRLKYDDAYMAYIWPKFQFTVTLDQELLINMDDEARWTIENKLVQASKIPNYFETIYFKSLEAVRPDAITIIR